jgi:prolyl-tRNA synthetase
LRSYKQLPQIWYQIQTKFRDEPRPRSGLLRVRQFIMKDSYSFDLDARGWMPPTRSITRLLPDLSSAAGWSTSRRGAFGRHGRQPVARVHGGLRRRRGFRGALPGCGYAANLEKAVSKAPPPAAADPEGDLEPEEFHTPAIKTIAEVAAFTGLPETSQIKSLVMVADGKPVLVLLRGDHQAERDQVRQAVGRAEEIRPAHPEEIREWFGADAGSLGPVGVRTCPSGGPKP